MPTSFDTPQDAEDAFYEAFEQGNLEVMERVWSARPDVVCIHPVAPPLLGPVAVLDSWRQVFESGMGLDITVHHHQWLEQGDLALHVVDEEISQSGPTGSPPVRVLATNAFRREDDGWHMALHHASPPPPPAQPQPVIPDAPTH